MSTPARPPKGRANPPAVRVEQGFRAASLRACGADRLCKAGPQSHIDRRAVK